MEYKHTLEVLLHEIKNVEQIVASFGQYEKIPKLEVDRALSKLINLYDLLAMLKETSANNTEMLSPDQQDNSSSENTDAENTLRNNTDSFPQPKQKMQDVTPDNGELPQESPVEPAGEKNFPAEDASTKPKGGVLADRFMQSQSYINEKVAAKQQLKDVSTVLQSRPISNIESAIGLNDKFSFIRELFNGDHAMYTTTIRRMDNAADFDEAYHCIKDFKWDMESMPVQRLLELMRRKFLTAQ